MSDLTIHRKIQSMLQRHRVADLLPHRAAGKYNLFWLRADGKSHIGATLLALPLIGCDQPMVQRLVSAASQPLPAGSLVQIETISTPDVSEVLHGYIQRKERDVARYRHADPVHQEQVLADARSRAAMFEQGRTEPLVRSSGVLCNRYLLLVSIKLPLAGDATDTDFEWGNDLISKLEHAWKAAGLMSRRATPNELLAILRQIFDPWSEYDPSYDEDEELRCQILDPGFSTQIDAVSGDVCLNGKTYVKILSAKKLPRRNLLAMMNRVIGDPDSVNNQITTPFIASLTLHYPDQAVKSQQVSNKAMWITHQADSILRKWSPLIGLKKHGFDTLTHEMANGGVYCEMSFQMTLLGRERKSVNALAASLQTYYASFGFDMREDKGIVWPMFYNILPLAPTSETIRNSFRFKTMSVRQAMSFAPVFGEYRGVTDYPVCIFQTRRGLVMGLDFYASPTNYNAAIFAESGAGKSVLTQQIIDDYLGIGAKIWVIDAGKSYKKQCIDVGGEFIEFSEDSHICLNPFTDVTDIDEDMPVLKSLLAAMAAPNDGLDDYRLARLEEAIKAVWSRRGTSMNVTDVADYMHGQDDQRIRDIAAQLFQYTVRGSYGRWFNGIANLKLSKQFVVLETDDLKNKPTLQKVVQLALIAKVQYEMYSAGTGFPKLFIADEVRELLPDRGFRYFLTSSYARFRKYDGAAIIIFQSLASLGEYPDLAPVLDNCRYKLVLKQTVEAIENIRQRRLLALDDYGYEQMKTIHTTDAFSEFMLINGPCYGVARHILDPLKKVMASTKGEDRHRIFALMQQGLSVRDAIQQLMRERSDHA